MKSILVPTDFSRNANNALNYAVSLAKKEKAKIILLHVFNFTYVSPDMPMAFYSDQLAATENEVNKILNGMSGNIKKSHKIMCEYISKQGGAVDVILDIIKKKKADLVVMGTKGASGIKEVLMGSNTAKVISKSSRPVIAVPEKTTFEGIKTIVFATDYRAGDIAALKQLTNIAKIFKAKIRILHIADNEYAVEDEFMEDFARKVKQKIDYKYISYQLLYSTDLEKKLALYLKKESASMLAMTNRDRSLIERLFEKSVAKKLVYHTKTPLIAFHYKH